MDSVQDPCLACRVWYAQPSLLLLLILILVAVSVSVSVSLVPDASLAVTRRFLERLFAPTVTLVCYPFLSLSFSAFLIEICRIR